MTLSQLLNKWSKNRKIVILALLVFFPIGIYLMWTGDHFNKDLRWLLTFLPVIAAIYFNYMIQDKPKLAEKNCSRTIIANGCTYQLDDNCKVISNSCD
jgi:hypothetical protein